MINESSILLHIFTINNTFHAGSAAVDFEDIGTVEEAGLGCKEV